MKRLPNWHELLAAHFEKSRKARFEWGKFDCAMSVCDGIQAVAGVDPGAPFRGQYSSEAEAMTLIGSDLGKFAAGIAQQHGFPEWASGQAESLPLPRFGRRGDVALIQARDPGLALGTIDHSGRFAWCASERGFIRVPMRFWLRAWKIA